MKITAMKLVGGAVMLSSLTASSSSLAMTQSQAEALTQCYSSLLNISPPTVLVDRTLSHDFFGTYSGGHIRLIPHATPETVAHEVRHAYQDAHGEISLFEYYLLPYDLQSHEKDAREWAAQNVHRCISSRPRSCTKRHRVVKGDTWWSLFKRYNLKRSWLNARSNSTLQLGSTVCVRGGS